MAWGLDDLRKFVNGLADTFNGGSGAPIQNVGMQNIQDAIVKPGKLLADFSGVTQGVKGVDPKASNMDRGLALLTLAGMLGGQEAAMGLKSAVTPKYAYGLHVSPTDGIKKIASTPATAIWDEMDNVPGSNYFWNTKNPTDSLGSLKQMQTYIDYYRKLPDNKATIYSIKTPLKHVVADENYAGIGLDALRTLKKLKVMGSIRSAGSGVDRLNKSDIPKLLDESNLFYEFLKKTSKKQGVNIDVTKLMKEDSRLFNKSMHNYKKFSENPTSPITLTDYLNDKLPKGKVYAVKKVNKKTTP
jgi:hypothetical protein